jgi:PAS domain S-box-containing protein
MVYPDPTELRIPNQAQRLQMFELLAETAPDGIAVTTIDGTITYANPALHAMLRYDVPIAGMPVYDLLADPTDTITSLIAQTAAQGTLHVLLTYQRSDGSTFPGQVSALRITDDQGTVWAVAGIVRNITEQLQMKAALETALTQSQRLLQEFIDNMPGVIYVYDLEHRYQLVNRQFLDLWQCTADQVIGKRDVECMPPDYIASWRAIDQQILATGQPIEIEETTRHEQPCRTFLSIKFPLYTADGTLYAIGGISTDITERKRMEDALRASTQRLRLFESLVEHAPDAISVLALDGTVQYANPAYQTIYQGDDALEGQPVANLYQDDPARLQELLHQVRTEGFWSGMLTHTGPNAQSFPTHVTAFALRSTEGEPTAIATFVRDISDQVRQEQERLALQTHIIAAQRAAIRDLSSSPSSSEAIPDTHALPLLDNDETLRERIRLGERLLAQAHQQVLIGREQEQRRIARELHDGAVQQLIGISYRLVEIRHSVNELEHNDPQRSEALNSALEATRWQLLTLVGQVRRLISELRPAGLEELGLTATLTSYVERLRSEGGASAPAIDLRIEDIALPTPHALCLFRVAQEALRNVLQHARSSHVTVVLRHAAAGVMFQITDDGCGFCLPPHLSDLMRANHFGLVGMTERVTWVGGHIHIMTHPGSGTTVMVYLPLHAEEDSNEHQS